MYLPHYNKSVGFSPALSQVRHGNEEQDELNWEWYTPSDDSLSVNFCLDTSLHGLHYLGQRRRHVCERIFWLAAVSAAIGSAGYLIWNMYALNRDMPIITVFSPTEMSIDRIPFPAVTICNVNNLRKSKFKEVLAKATEAVKSPFPHDEIHFETYATLLDMYYICESGNTFTSKFVENSTLGMLGNAFKDILFDQAHPFEKLVNPRKTLAENSQSCSEMILYCVWLGKRMDCNTYFQKVETDYGYCCTFNMAPLFLLVRNDSDPKTVEEWEKVSYDSLLFTEETKDREYPYRQQYPGREAGLSVFLDPDLDEYHCTNTDSHGFIVSLHSSLDFPRIKDNGISVSNSSEVLINIRPQITITDDSARSYSREKRHCYIGDEYKLPHYTKYTASNCMDECIANRTKKECDCVRYYMPHDVKKDKLCRPTDYNCVNGVREQIYQEGLGKACGFCLPTCTKIEYETETTSLRVIDHQVERLFNRSFGEFIAHHVFKKHDTYHHPSIVHIYFGVDSTHPRLRTESSSLPELISNAGGILGLCLGFSVLSLLEIAYYVTIRLGCNWYRDRSIEARRKENAMIMSYHNAAAMKMQMSNALRGGGWIQPRGGTVNPGFNSIQSNPPRYNTLFQKWGP